MTKRGAIATLGMIWKNTTTGNTVRSSVCDSARQNANGMLTITAARKPTMISCVVTSALPATRGSCSSSAAMMTEGAGRMKFGTERSRVLSSQSRNRPAKVAMTCAGPSRRSLLRKLCAADVLLAGD